jgi:hypothetical protein
MLRYLILLFFALLLSAEVNATAGCVDAAKTTIYTSQHPSGYYRTNSFNSSAAGCYYYYSGAICSIGSAGANNGYMGDTSNVQLCPIDDYVLDNHSCFRRFWILDYSPAQYANSRINKSRPTLFLDFD